MKEAQRVYQKHQLLKQSNQLSPFFKSNVQRNIAPLLSNALQDPGPGSYEVILPLIKPKYQAIFKNNRSIIIKVNDTPTPAFFSRQPRFKEMNTIQTNIQRQSTEPRDFQQQSLSKIKNSRRYNFSIARKKSNESISTSLMLTMNNAVQQHIKKKGVQWSKYKQKRQIWGGWQNRFSPGPGAYNQNMKEPKQYSDSKNSWQFRSSTKRSFSLKAQKYKTIDIPQQTDKSNVIHSRHKLIEEDLHKNRGLY